MLICLQRKVYSWETKIGGLIFEYLTTLFPGPSPDSKWQIGETPGQCCQNGSKNSLELCHINTMKCLCFVWTTVLDCRKQTGLPDTGNNLRKSHFIMCHMTKYSTILGVFQQPWPGVSPICHFERGEGPGDEVEYLIQRDSPSSPQIHIHTLLMLW